MYKLPLLHDLKSNKAAFDVFLKGQKFVKNDRLLILNTACCKCDVYNISVSTSPESNPSSAP